MLEDQEVEDKENVETENKDAGKDASIRETNDKGREDREDNNGGPKPSRGEGPEYSHEGDGIGATPNQPTTIPVIDPNKRTEPDTPKKRGFSFSPSRRKTKI